MTPQCDHEQVLLNQSLQIDSLRRALQAALARGDRYRDGLAGLSLEYASIEEWYYCPVCLGNSDNMDREVRCKPDCAKAAAEKEGK